MPHERGRLGNSTPNCSPADRNREFTREKHWNSAKPEEEPAWRWKLDRIQVSFLSSLTSQNVSLFQIQTPNSLHGKSAENEGILVVQKIERRNQRVDWEGKFGVYIFKILLRVFRFGHLVLIVLDRRFCSMECRPTRGNLFGPVCVWDFVENNLIFLRIWRGWIPSIRSSYRRRIRVVRKRRSALQRGHEGSWRDCRGVDCRQWKCKCFK